MEEMNWIDNQTILNAETMNTFQGNIKNAIDKNSQSIGNDTDTYSNAQTYSIGDIVVYNNQLYRCTTAITTAEEFDITKWQKTSLKEMMEVQNITTAGTDLNNYTENGTYFFNIANSPVNKPEGVEIEAGYLVNIVRDKNVNDIKQIWYVYNENNDTYTRQKRSGVWRPWKRLIVESDLYYKKGDTAIIGSYITGGFITASMKSIRFSVPLPKNIDNVTPTITGGTLTVRSVDGKYLLNASNIIECPEMVTYKNQNYLTLFCAYDSFDTVNNTPIGIEINNLGIRFD